jgi:1,4-alpha-glucan branching enzyme
MKRLNLVLNDPWLQPFEKVIYNRYKKAQQKELELAGASGSLKDFASGHLYFGLHRMADKWVMREWAPNATAISVLGTFNDWKAHPDYQFISIGEGIWELVLDADKMKHGDLYKLRMRWKGGEGDRIPAYARRVVQDDKTLIFSAQVWFPENEYKWEVEHYTVPQRSPLIYEAHAGMATEEYRVGTYKEFTQHIIPRIVKAGYNTIQLMAVLEHPYYGSFGYHVSSFFASSSRFGTPEDLKELIDTAHKSDIAVVMDLVHSHAVKNELEGLNTYDGSKYQFFHEGEQRNHPAWDSLCFNYAKNEVIHFLLSNCKYWLDEFHFDGYRFDGVTSMLYYDHGLSRDFTEYKMYYDANQDEDALTYLILANKLIHQIRPDALTIAEEMSGMPGTATPIEDGGLGFDYRLAMGTPDYWIKIIKEIPDEKWDVGSLFYELTRKRNDEKTIGYAESHDQALVGDKTIVFRLMDKEIYFNMQKDRPNLVVDRAIALHKLIRLITISTAGNGYLNFMGNEFGHPEWIDFPRAGNNWSYHYSRRQWSLADSPDLKYHYLGGFDKVMLEIIKEYRTLEHPDVYLLHENKPDQVLAFKRGELIFVFNFNPDRSFQNYAIRVDPGKYHIILDTDSLMFGGSGNVDETMMYYTSSVDDSKLMTNNYLKMYIPARTGLVFKKIPSRSVYDL